MIVLLFFLVLISTLSSAVERPLDFAGAGMLTRFLLIRARF